MNEYVKCKACGYIMDKSKLGSICPACGVPAKQFEPYDDKLSARRRFLLKLDIHPVIVHLPQAFALSLLLLGLGMFLATGEIRYALRDTAKVMSLVLPLGVLAAIAAGIFDGTVRFRKVTTPALKTKMLLGGLFFLASLGTAFFSYWTGLEESLFLGAFTAFAAVELLCASLLGIMGVPLTQAKFPG